jgi:hypothetical protein
MRSPASILPRILSAFILIIFCLDPAFAQPGPQPTLEDLEQRFQPTFDELAIQIGADQLNTSLYLRRAQMYITLARKAYYESKSGSAYYEKALADLSTAIGVNPTAEAYAIRAEVHYQRDPLRSDAEPKAVIDRCLKGYDQAIADQESAARLSEGDSESARHYSTLSVYYAHRAQPLAKPEVLAELRERGEKYLPWDDFDRSIEYARKANEHAQKLGDWWPSQYRGRVADTYFGKALAADGLGLWDVAREAYRQGEKYIDGGYFQICTYYSSWADVLIKKKMFRQAAEAFTRAMTASEASKWNCRNLLSRRADVYEALGDNRAALADYTLELEKDTYAASNGELSIKRAKLYLKLGEPEKARDDVTYALGKVFNAHCPSIYRLRAEAERRLGDLDAALADEDKAAHLPFVSSICADK